MLWGKKGKLKDGGWWFVGADSGGWISSRADYLKAFLRKWSLNTDLNEGNTKKGKTDIFALKMGRTKASTIKFQCIVMFGRVEEYMSAINGSDRVRYSQELQVGEAHFPAVVDSCFRCLWSNQASQRGELLPYSQPVCLWWSWLHLEL